MADVFLYDAVRTPRGKAKADGGLGALTPHELVKQQIDALRGRIGDAAQAPEALLLGCISQVGDQGGHISLVSKLHAGLPDATAAHSINNYCASGLSAIGLATAMVGSGQADSVLAGGVECMSRVPFMGDKAIYYTDASFPVRTRYIPVVLAAEAVIGVLFSAWLTYLELAVIHAICVWCVTSAAIVAAIALVGIADLREIRRAGIENTEAGSS